MFFGILSGMAKVVEFPGLVIRDRLFPSRSVSMASVEKVC